MLNVHNDTRAQVTTAENFAFVMALGGYVTQASNRRAVLHM